MIEHPNSLLIHHCLQAAREGDRHTLRVLWAPDIIWRITGSSPWSGEVKGADNILARLAELGEIGASGLRTEIEDIMVSNERAALICRAFAEIDERVLDARFMILTVIASRRIQEITSIPIDPNRVAEFWGRKSSKSTQTLATA